MVDDDGDAGADGGPEGGPEVGSEGGSEGGSHDRLDYTRADRVWTYVLLAGGGGLLLLLGPVVAAWLADVPFVPFSDLLRWIGGFDGPLAWFLRPVVGVGVGAAFAALVIDEAWSLEVHDDHVVTVRGRDRRRLDRSSIVGVYLDRKRVVIDGEDGRVLFDKKVEARRDVVHAAFVSRGYPFENE